MTESNPENADSQTDKIDERFQQEMGESESRLCLALRLLQFLQNPLHDPLYSSNGGWDHQGCLEFE
jgi:hypothetical protein